MHSRILAGLVLVAVVSVVGIGLASAQGDTVYHACVKPSGAMFLVDGPDACKGKDTHISWSQEGPAGPQGPQGEAGPQGEQGPSGVLGFYTRHASITTSDYAQAVTAWCDPGDKLTGGGQGVSYPVHQTIYEASPVEGDLDGWHAKAVNPSGQALILASWVVCADMTP